MPFRPGYNLVEKNLLGAKFEDCFEVVSIIHFLRLLSEDFRFPQTVKVVGLPLLLEKMTEKEETRFLRRTLSGGAERLLRQSPIVVFPVEEITMNAEPYLIRGKDKIRLRPIFGNRLEQKDVGYFYAPFNIG